MFLSTLKLGSAIALLGVALVGSVAVVAQQGPATGNAQPATQQAPKSASQEPPVVERRVINKKVSDFPDKTDLSTPESAQAAWNRAWARMDDQALLELSWVKWGPRDIQRMQRARESNPKETEVFNKAQLNAEILEVTIRRKDWALVISKLDFPPGVGRDAYSTRAFGKFKGLWKNLGENRLPSLEAARVDVASRMEKVGLSFEELREKIEQGIEAPAQDKPARDRRARIAPGEPQGISVEKADLMGRVEWVMLHSARDITARRSIEWGEIQRDAKGNRTIRYKFDATIWDKDVSIMNKVFTFDAKGNLLDMEDVDGFPVLKEKTPVNINTQEGLKELVEDFFHKNYRDITSRESLEWGEVVKSKNGSASIRYKYRATILDKETKIFNRIFTFNQQGKFVSVKGADGNPQNR